MISFLNIKGSASVASFEVQVATPASALTDIAVWTSKAPMITARESVSGCGVATASLVIGGYTRNSNSDLVELYNGTTWSNQAPLPLYTYSSVKSSSGLSNNALFFGILTTQGYDGTTWSISSDMLLSRYYLCGSGLTSSSIGVGGLLGGVHYRSAEMFNGTTWSTISDSTWVRINSSLSGLDKRLLVGGRYADGRYADVFDGTAWTDIGTTLLELRVGLSSAGNAKNCLIFGGGSQEYTSNINQLNEISNNTEFFNGSNFLIKSPMLNYRAFLAGSGSSNSALASGGYVLTSFTDLTEQYGSTTTFTNISSGWVSSSSLLSARSNGGGSGVSTSCLAISGDYHPYTTTSAVNNIEWFNGWVWSSHANLSTPRYLPGSSGSSTSTLIAGGSDGVDISTSSVEIYDGSTCATRGNIPLALDGNSATGDSSSALSFGGSNGTFQVSTWLFNGTTWSSTANLPISIYGHSSVGSSKECLSIAGKNHYNILDASTNIYDGITWRAASPILTVSMSGVAGGSIAKALYCIGSDFSYSSLGNSSMLTNLYDGISWTSGENKIICAFRSSSSSFDSSSVITGGAVAEGVAISNTVRYKNVQVPYTSIYTMGITSGLNLPLNSDYLQSALILNLLPNTVYLVEATNCLLDWNGSLLFESTKSVTTSSAGLVSLAVKATSSASFETSFVATISIPSIPYSTSFNVTTRANLPTWSVYIPLLAARGRSASAGVSTNALSFGGYNTIYKNTTELFNGSSWSSVSGMLVARYGLGGSGISTNALSFGGSGSSSYYANTENYNGISWAARANMLNTRRWLAGCGVSLDSLAFGASSSGKGQIVERYNGTVWAAQANLGVPRGYLAGTGISVAALSIGGYYYYSALYYTNTVELFNGTAWTTVAPLSQPVNELAASGISTAALAFGGCNLNTPTLATTENYNGITWSVVSPLITSRNDLGGTGSSLDSLAIGGYAGSYLANVEHYTLGV